jgi:subtilase family serine protease
LRLAYSLNPLLAKGFDGKGQTIVDIVSYGSPLLQHDLHIFDQQFQLPPVDVQQIAPLGTVPYDPHNSDMAGWATETDLDVEIMHALAPGAHIVVLTSPVDETQGMAGLPQFLQLEQYAVRHHLGQILCQSFVTAEVNFPTSQNQRFLQQFASFDEQATTKDGWTIFAASGDNGATDYNNVQSTTFSPTPTVDFAADMPWVIAVGGTTLHTYANSSAFNETAWQGSGGGFSQFFSEPDYQRLLPPNVQRLLHGKRGVPDVAADADPATGLEVYLNGQWTLGGGTSASQPAWTALIAIADQMAGHPLGFLNPALYRVGTSPAAHKDFRDIVAGNNSHQGVISVPGYNAVPGWDPVTGFGSPLASFLLPDLIAASQPG